MAQTTGRLYDQFARLMNDAAGVAQGVRREFDSATLGRVVKVLEEL